jgi:hypothetical protein
LGDFFVYWQTVFFGSFLKITELAQILGILFSTRQVMYWLRQKMGQATFGAIFFQNSSGHPGMRYKQAT